MSTNTWVSFWTPNCPLLVILMRKGLGIIKHLSPYLLVSTLDQIYKMYVRPQLNFCDEIFHVPKKLNEFDSSILLDNLMDSIERIQCQAALAITGEWKGRNPMPSGPCYYRGMEGYES